jgi:hypothetical protein
MQIQIPALHRPSTRTQAFQPHGKLARADFLPGGLSPAPLAAQVAEAVEIHIENFLWCENENRMARMLCHRFDYFQI